jgi:mRNA-degrading endonuclease YafQ of YafQ-DinJ toxin-antitoxin module
MDKPILAASRFRTTWKKLDRRLRECVIDVILELPELQANAHKHSGTGFRRLHGADFWEARLDLRWRLILHISKDEIVLFDVMNHDQVRRLR